MAPARRKTNPKSITFPHLQKAPISEAVIEIRGPAGIAWEEKRLIDAMQEHIITYPEHRPFQAIQMPPPFPTGGEQSATPAKLVGVTGLRFESGDHHSVVMFTSEQFTFSRINSYNSWQPFVGDAIKFWKVHRSVTDQPTIRRIGVRFINRIPISQTKFRLDSYLKGIPSALPGSEPERLAFLHQDIISVPGTNLKASIIKTVQGGIPTDDRLGLILDIDVFDEKAFATDDTVLMARLEQIHHWKNWIFFSIVTNRVIEEFK